MKRSPEFVNSKCSTTKIQKSLTTASPSSVAPNLHKEQTYLKLQTAILDSNYKQFLEVIETIKKRQPFYNINHLYSGEDTALHLVARCVNNENNVAEKMTLALLANGAVVDILNAEDYSAITVAAHHNNRAVVETILDYGKGKPSAVDYSRKEYKERTLLHICSFAGSKDVFNYLLLNFAKDPAFNKAINAQDIYLQTPLHKAVYHGDPYFVKKLLEHGADPTILDKQGRMPINFVHQNPNTKEQQRNEIEEILNNAMNQKVAHQPEKDKAVKLLEEIITSQTPVDLTTLLQQAQMTHSLLEQMNKMMQTVVQNTAQPITVIIPPPPVPVFSDGTRSVPPMPRLPNLTLQAHRTESDTLTSSNTLQR